MKFNLRETDDFCVKFVPSDLKDGCDKINYLFENKYFNGENAECFLYSGEKTYELFVGLGRESEKTADSVKTAALAAGKYINDLGIRAIFVKIRSTSGMEQKKQTLAICEGLLNSTYNFDNYKKDKKDVTLEEVSFLPALAGNVEQSDFDELLNKWQGICLTRDLVNTPAMDMYPEILAMRAKELETLGISVSIYDEAAVRQMGMSAFLSVSAGSAKKPFLIVMEYNKSDEAPIALVGKGITYDSGGYNLKPGNSMKSMKSDMAGAATVIGTMKTLALSKSKTHVVGIIAACENMISGNAYKPGDIIPSLAGLHIEIDNTDAEGRLTLADAVCYAEKKFSPKLIIDIATLTGACVVALGEHYSGVLGNSSKYINLLKKAAAAEDEKVWELPATEDFKKLNDSKIADINNTGGRWGGASSAGLFIGSFIENTDWLHIDFAGPAFNEKPYLFEPAGATGHMVKTLYRLTDNIQLKG